MTCLLQPSWALACTEITISLDKSLQIEYQLIPSISKSRTLVQAPGYMHIVDFLKGLSSLDLSVQIELAVLANLDSDDLHHPILSAQL